MTEYMINITSMILTVRINMMTIFFLLALSNVIVAEDKTMYTTKYDNIDVDAIIKSDRLLSNYVNCLMDEKPCTPDGAELKKNLPDALATDCESCSETQKSIADKLYHHLIDNKLDDWLRLEEKYDPSAIYRKKYLSKNLESTTEQ